MGCSKKLPPGIFRLRKHRAYNVLGVLRLLLYLFSPESVHKHVEIFCIFLYIFSSASAFLPDHTDNLSDYPPAFHLIFLLDHEMLYENSDSGWRNAFFSDKYGGLFPAAFPLPPKNTGRDAHHLCSVFFLCFRSRTESVEINPVLQPVPALLPPRSTDINTGTDFPTVSDLIFSCRTHEKRLPPGGSLFSMSYICYE